jgi:hypothetical protein
MFLPIQQLVQQAIDRQEIRSIRAASVTGAFLSLMDGMQYGQVQAQGVEAVTRAEMVEELMTMLLDGLHIR